MELYGSCSDDSIEDDQDIKDSALSLLDQYKFKLSDFSQPNLGKNLAENETLTQSQIILLENFGSTNISEIITNDTFISIIREISDIRSFRVLFVSEIGTVYDYSLICLDVYFHNFITPAVILRTGLGQVNLSMFFQENGLISNDFLRKGIAS